MIVVPSVGGDNDTSAASWRVVTSLMSVCRFSIKRSRSHVDTLHLVGEHQGEFKLFVHHPRCGGNVEQFSDVKL